MIEFDPQARERFIIVALKVGTVNDAPHAFSRPKPRYTASHYPQIRDILVDDDEVPDSAWGHKVPVTFSLQQVQSRSVPMRAVNIG